MAKKKYPPFHAFMQKMASTKPGAWFYSRTLHHFDRVFLKLSGGKLTMTSLATGLPMVTLTTTGAKSGQPRSVPIIGIVDPECPEKVAFIASNWGQDHNPAWYYNMKAHPKASITRGDEVLNCTAHEAAGDEYELFWQDASDLYLGYPHYKERAGERRIPIIVLEPEEPKKEVF